MMRTTERVVKMIKVEDVKSEIRQVNMQAQVMGIILAEKDS